MNNQDEQPPSINGSSRKPCLVTGGTGLLGSHLLHELVGRGEPVRAIKRAGTRLDMVASIADKIEWVDADLQNVDSLVDALQGVDRVFHCAGFVSFVPKEVPQLYKVNVEGTANLVNAALEAGVRRLVHVSSVAALGRSMHQPTVNEDSEWEDSPLNSSYAQSKFKGECEVWRGFAEGLSGVIVNPSIIFGIGGNWNDGSMKMIKSVWEGLPYYLPGVNGFVDARDVVRAMLELSDSDIDAERFVLNAENLSYKNVIHQVAAHLHVKSPDKEAPRWLLELGWRWEALRSKISGSRPILTKETAKTSTVKTYYDNSKIQEYLPDFSFTPIETTLREACEVFLETYPKGQQYAEPHWGRNNLV